LRLAEFKMRLFVFFADKLLQWGHRVEQEVGYRQLEPARPEAPQRSAERLRRDREQDGPPEHWARLVASVPPAHWLELLRRAEAEPFSKFDSSAEAEVAESVAFNETDAREPIHKATREDRESGERSTIESRRNRSDYSAARGPSREFAKLALPAVSPDGFLNRLHFLAEPPPADLPVSDYVRDAKTENGNDDGPGSLDRSVTTSGESKAVFNRSTFHEDQANPPMSSRSPGLDFVAREVRTQPAANSFPAVDPPGNRASAVERPFAADPVQNNKRDPLSIITNSPTSQHSRPTFSASQTTARRTSKSRRYVSRRAQLSLNSRSDYQHHESPRQPTTVSYVGRSNDAIPSRRANISEANSANISEADSDRSAKRSDVRVKRSELVSPPPTVARASFSDSADQGFHSQDTKTVNDSNEQCWPGLPAAAAFDLDDDLFAREAEVDGLRRLDQEQRGTLWSE